MIRKISATCICLLASLGCATERPAQGAPTPPAVQATTVETATAAAPLATVDLTTREGAALMNGTWRYHDVAITRTTFLDAGPDGQPGNTQNSTYDVEPKAGRADYDDSDWQVIDPTTLDVRRTAGKVSFNWYRITLTIPDRIGAFDPTGSTVWFEISVDDYAEVWVNGELPRRFGQRGGSVVNGWNAPNRLVVGRDVKPGKTIQLAVFGINGPISQSPTNYIYVRRARLEFVEGTTEPVAVEPQEVNALVQRNGPAIDKIVPSNPKIFKVAEGFTFTEGPIWVGDHLLFSDPNENRIYRYSAQGELTVFREKSGYAESDVDRYSQPGSNGNTLDPQGRLITAEHGNRRVTRTETDGSITVLADAYQGKRLNSPNDLVCKSDGAVYFTDPPFGLPGFFDDPGKELPFSGVYRAMNGEVDLLAKDLRGPNGIAFSPDEHFLYVSNWDTKRKIVMRYRVKDDGTLREGKVFFDMKRAPQEDALDGLKVDTQGNVYASGPGGVWILSAAGKHLGTIAGPQPIHNFAWGGEDAKTLYMTAHGTLYRMPLLVEGIRP